MSGIYKKSLIIMTVKIRRTADLMCFSERKTDLQATLAVNCEKLQPMPFNAQCFIITQQAEEGDDIEWLEHCSDLLSTPVYAIRVVL